MVRSTTIPLDEEPPATMQLGASHTHVSAGATAFVGRVAELAAVDAFLADVRLGHCGLLAVEAEAGAGKSSLLRHAVAHARIGDAFTVHRAEGDPNDPRALRCMASAFDCRLTSDDPARVRIAELLRASDPQQPSGGVVAAQELLIDLLERSALERPVVLVVDDLQWVDDASVALLGSVVRRLRGCSVGVLVATRPSPHVQRVLAPIGPRHLTLGPLGDDDLAALATSIRGAAPSSQELASLHAVRSSPFLVTLLAGVPGVPGVPGASGADDGSHRNVGAGAGAGAGVGVGGDAARGQDALRRMTASLDQGLREFLELAALAGREVDVDALAAATDGRVPVAVARTREAQRGGWLSTDGESVRFRHDLLAEALVGLLPVDRRDDLHLRLGRAFAALGHAPGRAAYHLDAAAYLLSRADVALLVGLLSILPGDDPLALGLAQRAVELAPEHGDVVCALMKCLAIRHRPAEALSVADRWEAVAEPRAGGGDAVAGRIRLLRAAANVPLAGNDAVAAQLEADIDAGAFEGEQHAEALNMIARLHWYRRDAARVRAAATQALAASRVVGSLRGEVQALCSGAEAAALLGDVESALRDAHEALRLSSADPNPSPAPELALGTALAAAGRMREGLPVLTRSLLAAERAGDPHAMVLAQVAMQGTRFHIGEWDAYVADADAMAAIGSDTGLRAGVVLPLGFAALVAVRRGRFGEVPALTARLRLEHTMGDVHPGAVLGAALGELATLEAAGRLAEACTMGRQFVELLASAGFSAQGLICMDVARLAWEVGDHASLDMIAELLDASQRLAPTPTRSAMAGVARALRDGGPSVVADAARTLASTERAWDAATALHIAGVLAAERSGAPTEATGLLSEAADRYESLGALPCAAIARRGQRFGALFAAVAAPGATSAPTGESAEELSAAERRVLALVVDGLANGDIADVLYVSKRTVESHLGSLYRKLGVTTRVALARAGRGRA